MKLKADADVAAFMQTVQKCRQEVFFDTAEGDHLNLKSTLSQFVFISALVAQFDRLEWKITFAEEDAELLLPYLT